MFPRTLRYLLLFVALAANCYAPGAFKLAAATAVPELLDFGATWCKPCARMAEEVRQIEASGMKVTRIDVDKRPDLKAQWGVASLPTFVLVVNGREMDRLVGAQPHGVLSELVRRSPVRTAPASQFRARGEFPQDVLAGAQVTANRERRKLALEWLGHELPSWDQPCDLHLAPATAGSGQTDFYTSNGRASHFKISVQGTPHEIMNDVVPHEVMHTVLATHFGQHLPRWADEGAAMCTESERSRRGMQARLVEYLQTGRGIPTSQLLNMRDYPRDILPLYAQGTSLVSFLVEANGQQGFVAFLEDGLSAGWESAFKTNFDYGSLDELQNSWLEWVRAGSPRAPYAAAFRGCGQCFRWRPLKRLWEHRPGFVIPRRQAAPIEQTAPVAQTQPEQPPAGNMVPVGPPPVVDQTAQQDNTLPTSPGPNNDVPPPATGTPANDTQPVAQVPGLADLKAEFDARLADVEKKKQAIIDGLQGRLNQSLAESGALGDKLKQALKDAAAVAVGSSDQAAAGNPAEKALTWFTTEALMYMGLGAGPAGLLAFFGIRAARKHAGKYRAQLDELRDRLRDEPANGTATTVQPGLVRRNRYVPYETNVLDKAWADAAAILVEKFPGYKVPLKHLEELKDQLLSGVPRKPIEES